MVPRSLRERAGARGRRTGTRTERRNLRRVPFTPTLFQRERGTVNQTICKTHINSRKEQDSFMSHHTLEDAILNFVAQSGYRPMKPRAIAHRLHLSKDQMDEVKRSVKRLVRAGKLAYGANHLVRAGGAAAGKDAREKSAASSGAASKSRVLGVFHRTQKGFGFVRPQAPSPTTDAADSSAAGKPAAKKPGLAAARAPPASRTSTSRENSPATPPAATSCWCNCNAAADRRTLRAERRPGPRSRWARGERSSKWSIGRRGGSSAFTFNPAGRATSRSTVRSSPSRFAWAIRAQERAGGRQSGLRNGPLPLARPGRRRRDRRGARSAGHAGGRYPFDPPRVQPARTFRRGRSRRGAAGGREIRRVDSARPARPDRLDNRDDRSG